MHIAFRLACWTFFTRIYRYRIHFNFELIFDINYCLVFWRCWFFLCLRLHTSRYSNNLCLNILRSLCCMLYVCIWLALLWWLVYFMRSHCCLFWSKYFLSTHVTLCYLLTSIEDTEFKDNTFHIHLPGKSFSYFEIDSSFDKECEVSLTFIHDSKCCSCF